MKTPLKSEVKSRPCTPKSQKPGSSEAFSNFSQVSQNNQNWKFYSIEIPKQTMLHHKNHCKFINSSDEPDEKVITPRKKY